ncbi:MAG: hypothetical protein M1828_000127 [Chrysothrix sp. TS-e1954]|nr:MAG: hypothetical protein M1828_000127 [Chrysothrix sp. TS-e1954]
MAKFGPFATFLIIGPTCFFLGMLFMSFPYDYYVLWATPPAATAGGISDREPYLALLESHLRFLHASPPLINRILHIVIGTGLAGIFFKLYKPTEANMLFDGASLVLYMCGITVYIANIVKGLRVVTDGDYGENAKGKASEGVPEELIGREDSLKVIAASNTILALVLVGVLILQAGQWYAMKKEQAEIEEMDRVADGKKRARDEGKSGVQGAREEREKKRS